MKIVANTKTVLISERDITKLLTKDLEDRGIKKTEHTIIQFKFLYYDPEDIDNYVVSAVIGESVNEEIT